MCNVVQFRFTCKHTLRVRRSRCNGTKHRITRTSIRAACTAESFLTISLTTVCGPCQHACWEQNWTLKLSRARSFLAKLKERHLPGVQHITSLVKDLENEYTQASWDTRNTFAQVPKKPVTRVTTSDRVTARSPLLQELHPDDITETAKTKEWTDMDDADYDGDYVASTDPLHPVSTDYSHPLDDDDGSWILQHLTPEDQECPLSDAAIDYNDSPWSWGDGNGIESPATPGGYVPVEAEAEHARSQSVLWEPTATVDVDIGPLARDPGDASALSPPAKITMNGLSNSASLLGKQAAHVETMFWAVVNDTALNRTRQPHSEIRTPSDLLSELDTSTYNPSETSSSSWTNSISNNPPTSPPSSLPCASTPPPTSNSARVLYDKYRQSLAQANHRDVNKHYRDWLLTSRLEARAFEGPEGRGVPDPLMLRGG